MLRELHIENVAVIKRVDVTLDRGLTVLTGETGAGKSILIDSVNLVLGGKFNREIIRTGEARATVSAVFDELSEDTIRTLGELGLEVDEQDGSVLLQRVMHEDGKSSCRFCGSPITASMMREIGRCLLNIHGQNDNQRLLERSSHLSLLDAMGEVEEQKARYRACYERWLACREELSRLGQSEAEKARLREMLEYQIKDIDSASLKQQEEQALLRERDRLQNVEKIEKYVRFTRTALDRQEKGASACYLLERSTAALRQISDVIPQAADYAEQLEDMMYRVRDIAQQISAWSDDEVIDPSARLDAIESRLDTISRLEKKYGETIADVLAFRERALEQLESLDGAQDRFERLSREKERLEQECCSLAKDLSECRRSVAQELTERVQAELAFLDMPKVRFSVSIRPSEELLSTGRDEVEFLIATNPGQPLMPMIKIASGGELSRLMLAIKSVLNDKDGVDTVVFDEVDTGISGKTSRKVGIRLCQMGRSSQVICITHAAQIASLADTHMLITKDTCGESVETRVLELDKQGRVDEISRILGGLHVTDSQREAAEDMIAEREQLLLLQTDEKAQKN